MAPRSHLIWPFSIPDWKRDTSQLSQAECAGYLNLLMFYWEHGEVPDDDNALRRIAGAESGIVWREQRRKLRKFFLKGWKHKRMDADLAAAARYSDRQRANARKRWLPVESGESQNDGNPYTTGQKRKQNQRHVDAVGMPRECSLIKQLKPVSISVVESGQSSKLTASPNRKPSKQNQAEQAWQRDLLHAQGSAVFSVAIEKLAAHPEIVDRATQAEMREPGSGALVAMLALSHEAVP